MRVHGTGIALEETAGASRRRRVGWHAAVRGHVLLLAAAVWLCSPRPAYSYVPIPPSWTGPMYHSWSSVAYTWESCGGTGCVTMQSPMTCYAYVCLCSGTPPPAPEVASGDCVGPVGDWMLPGTCSAYWGTDAGDGRASKCSQRKLTMVVSPQGVNPPVPTSTFKMLPSVLSSGGIPPEYHGTNYVMLPLDLACTLDTGEIVPHCNITLEWEATAGSGGHVHNTSRPPGVIFSESLDFAGSVTAGGPPARLSVNSAGSGIVPIRFMAPEASGTTVLRVTGQAGTLASDPSPVSIQIQYDGLQLAAGDGLAVSSASSLHGSNNGFASADLVATIQVMAARFAENLVAAGIPRAQVPPIRVTAMSLPLGGLFDFSQEWAPPHVSHRFGNDADLGMAGLNALQKAALAEAAATAGLAIPIAAESPSSTTASHWHVRLPW